MLFFVGFCRAGLRSCLDTAGRAFVWVNDFCGECGSGSFFSGSGYWCVSFWARWSTDIRPLILFAYIEIGLGLLALISPYVFDFADFLYGIAYRLLSDAPFLRFTTRLLLVALVVLPPTVLMGGTLPLFCRQYSRNSGRIARAVGLLYGVNTLGAALGCAAAGFVFLPDLGSARCDLCWRGVQYSERSCCSRAVHCAGGCVFLRFRARFVV